MTIPRKRGKTQTITDIRGSGTGPGKSHPKQNGAQWLKNKTFMKTRRGRFIIVPEKGRKNSRIR